MAEDIIIHSGHEDSPSSDGDARVEHTQLSREELSELVDIVLLVGQSMLLSGAANFRTEQTMAQIGLGMGADRLELFVTTTGIIATAVSGSEQRTRVGRVGPLGVNMAQVVGYNRLSRYMSLIGGTLDSTRRQVMAIKAKPRDLPAWATIPAVGLACGGFAQNLGGGWGEFAAATLGAALAQWTRLKLHALGVSAYALTVVSAFFAVLAAWGICEVADCPRPDLAVAASVLLLVPGVPLVTSVIDLTNHDMVSGLARAALSILLALAIGVGVMLALWVTGLRILP
ncbi:MAG TPA: threonine/serine exporter family protein [Aggregatilinea sp.]|uniref:threonine/serine exporter family protein n=1 Tax=Aggregatilinea sp. TaxID=2806333 RepID=UPI002BE1ABCF|nr:threonine/serine exporter family protein [Aggregatilinea sp.]HML23632.1 threonine/serine exporter family protein [Aggregatilinea sp.]